MNYEMDYHPTPGNAITPEHAAAHNAHQRQLRLDTFACAVLQTLVSPQAARLIPTVPEFASTAYDFANVMEAERAAEPCESALMRPAGASLTLDRPVRSRPARSYGPTSTFSASERP